MYNLIQWLDFRFLHTNLVCIDLYFSSVKVKIWLSKKTAFLQKSEHVTGSLAEPWNSFLALQLPEAGTLQPQTFITHFSGTHEAIQHPYLPYHTRCLWASMSSGWLTLRAESLASHHPGACAATGQGSLQGVSSQYEHWLQHLQTAQHLFRKSTGPQNLQNLCNFWNWETQQKRSLGLNFPRSALVGMVVLQLVIPGILSYPFLRLAQLIYICQSYTKRQHQQCL